jgi:hypothetical protein
MSTILPFVSTVFGLMLFEIISSIDNAVINAEILSELPPKNRRWFMSWGLFLAVFGMRGILPWLVLWLAVPAAGAIEPLRLETPRQLLQNAALRTSSQGLLMAAGTILLLIFVYWLLVEHPTKPRELRRRTGFFLVLGALLVGAGMYTAPAPELSRAIAVGTIFFLILLMTKRLAALPKQHMSRTASRRAKVTYLEVLDSIFSVEAVFGAFAFTFSVPLILLGNGTGAIIVRYVTATRGATIRKLLFLKKGAMYALGCIGMVMILDGLGASLPGWLSILTTAIAMGLAFIQRAN